MIVGTVDLGRAAQLPVKGSIKRDQSVFIAMDGTVRARDAGPVDEFLRYKVRNVEHYKKEQFISFIRNDAQFKKNTFTLEDDYGSTFIVRYWGKDAPWTETLGRRYEIDLVFRVENIES